MQSSMDAGRIWRLFLPCVQQPFSKHLRLGQQWMAVSLRNFQRILSFRTEAHASLHFSDAGIGIFFQNSAFTVVLISLSMPTSDENETIMHYSLTSILDDRFRQDARCHTFAYSSDILAMILNLAAEDVPHLTKEIEQYMITSLPIQPIIGVGYSVSALA